MAKVSFNDMAAIQERLIKIACKMKGFSDSGHRRVAELATLDVQCADDADFLLIVSNWIGKFGPAFPGLNAVLAEAKYRCPPETYEALKESLQAGAFRNSSCAGTDN